MTPLFQLFISSLSIGIRLFLGLTLLLGVLYPLFATGLLTNLFPHQSQGSPLIEKTTKKIIGSALIGQAFTEDRYFWGRLSATPEFPYNPSFSAASNQHIDHPDYAALLNKRLNSFIQNQQFITGPIPYELITASASGLDPHISVGAALFQVSRIAKVRKMEPNRIFHLIQRHTTPPFLGIWGEAVVNLLTLNYDLDQQ
jgi:K+-transporting ATPase ATPase C chain